MNIITEDGYILPSENIQLIKLEKTLTDKNYRYQLVAHYINAPSITICSYVDFSSANTALENLKWAALKNIGVSFFKADYGEIG